MNKSNDYYGTRVELLNTMTDFGDYAPVFINVAGLDEDLSFECDALGLQVRGVEGVMLHATSCL